MASISEAQPLFSPCPIIIWEQGAESGYREFIAAVKLFVFLVLLVLPRLAVESPPWGSPTAPGCGAGHPALGGPAGGRREPEGPSNLAISGSWCSVTSVPDSREHPNMDA